MKKFILILLFVFLTGTARASFERDLYFGLKNDSEVTKLQEFLQSQNLYTGPITGNFFSLTREAVKKFQGKEGITPPLGYFGPLTRVRANSLLTSSKTKEEQIAELNSKIKNLQDQLVSLQAKLASGQEIKVEEATTTQVTQATSTPAEPEPATSTSTPASVKTNKLIVTNSATSTFPSVVTTPYKVGEITLNNDTDKEILFVNFETILYDEMDSTFNRDHKVYFLLRDGTSYVDTQISKTEFTFVLTAPLVGSPHRAVVKFPFDVMLKAGEKKAYSMWIEQLQYVRSGTLKIDSTAINTINTVTKDGKINLVLTKEPPL